MGKTIVTYETFHGSAKKIALIIAEKLGTKCINIDTPFEVEDLKEFDNIILVFNFRGPYTAQLTKLYLNRVKEQFKNKNMILVGEGLFSEKEFPIVAQEIQTIAPSKNFAKFFVTGQLRVDTLFPEEKVLLAKFSELTGMEIKDMGELDLVKANMVASEIGMLIASEAYQIDVLEEDEAESIEWICDVCGYVHKGQTPPATCPLCGVPSSHFYQK